MKEDPVAIKFNNQVNPDSEFDLLNLERIYKLKGLDHDIEKIHKVEFFAILLVTEGQIYQVSNACRKPGDHNKPGG